jgi:hypothetical protein
MSKMLTACPACGGPLRIKLLQCQSCGMELKSDFDRSEFDSLSDEQRAFLLEFLKCRGNLSLLQEGMGISYPTAKKRLGEVLLSLGLISDIEIYDEETADNMDGWKIDAESTVPSEIVKAKLKTAGGRAVVHSINGNSYEIRAAADGENILCPDLPPVYTYQVFNVIVDLLRRQGGRARKGGARGARVGEPDCDDTTVAGAIGIHYFGKAPGESTFDPVFVLASVLDWAGIAYNRRGYLELTPEYKSKL